MFSIFFTMNCLYQMLACLVGLCGDGDGSQGLSRQDLRSTLGSSSSLILTRHYCFHGNLVVCNSSALHSGQILILSPSARCLGYYSFLLPSFQGKIFMWRHLTLAPFFTCTYFTCLLGYLWCLQKPGPDQGMVFCKPDPKKQKPWSKGKTSNGQAQRIADRIEDRIAAAWTLLPT